MRKGLGNYGGMQLGAILVLLFAGLMSGTPAAFAYPAAEAEAQGDPGSDPYGFPNIKLCCEKPRQSRQRCCSGPKPPTGPDGPPPYAVVVNCAVPTSAAGTLGSMREALEIRGVNRITVIPGAPCDISGLVIGRSMTIESGSYGYGARARLGGGACLSVAAAGSGGPVVVRGFDIDGCLVVQSGELQLIEDNVSWRGQGPAVQVNGGIFATTHSTVRAREAAVDAGFGALVSLNDSQFASMADSRQVVRLNVENVRLTDILVKGGRTGIQIDTVATRVDLNNVQVLRAQADDPYPPRDPGDFGIVVADNSPVSDLPWLSGMQSRQYTIRSSTVGGYNVGIRLGTAVRGVVDNVTVLDAAQGISVASSAQVELTNNHILRSRSTGISLEAGARGMANHNELTCSSGRCVCYGGDCSSRSNYVFGSGAFRMTDTDCDD